MKDVKQWDEWLLSVSQLARAGWTELTPSFAARRGDHHRDRLDPSRRRRVTSSFRHPFRADPRLPATVKPLLAKLEKKKLSLVFPSTNLVDNIWTDRPLRSAADIVLHPLKFSGTLLHSSSSAQPDLFLAGQPAEEKLSALRSYLSTTSTFTSSFLLSSLPNIAWLLNLRGDDIAFNPVFYAYLLVPASGEEKFVLWVQDAAVGYELREEIERLGGEVREYEKALEEIREREGKVVADGKVSWALIEAAGEVSLFPVFLYRPRRACRPLLARRTTSSSSLRPSSPLKPSRMTSRSRASRLLTSAMEQRGSDGWRGWRRRSNRARRSASGRPPRSSPSIERKGRTLLE